MSPWLGAICALERRLTTGKLTLSQYRALGLLHEFKGVEEEKLASFISHNEDVQLGYEVIKSLMVRQMIERDEETELLVLTVPGKHVIDEVYRLVHTRLTQPLFQAPEH